jgi:hypothetical protein
MRQGKKKVENNKLTLSIEPTVDPSKEIFSWSVPNLNSLRLFAAEKFGWDQKMTDEKILPAIKRYNAPDRGKLPLSLLSPSLLPNFLFRAYKARAIIPIILFFKRA